MSVAALAINLILALATLVLAGLAWRQANAAQVSAEAAKESAEAFMNSERAWLVVDPAPDCHPGAWDYGGGPVPQNFFRFHISNAGKTPARIVESTAKYVILDRLENLPSVPDYGTPQDENDILIPCQREAPGSRTAVVFLEPSPVLKPHELSAVERQEKFLYAYGRYTYRDASGREFRTAFGFVYHAPIGGDPRPKGWRRSGPDAYNGFT
jgi:hypothetical protein